MVIDKIMAVAVPIMLAVTIYTSVRLDMHLISDDYQSRHPPKRKEEPATGETKFNIGFNMKYEHNDCAVNNTGGLNE